MQALGATVERTGAQAWRVAGRRRRRLRASRPHALDFGNSGTGCRLVMGAVAGCPIEAVFDGDASLRTRPMRRILDPLEKMGARATMSAMADGCRSRCAAPAIRFRSNTEPRCPRRSSNRRCCWPALLRPGTTVLIEQEATRDHTEKMLQAFRRRACRSRRSASHGRRIALDGQPELEAAPVVVPADPSSAAFPLVAALIVPGSEIILDGVMTNPLRAGLLATLREMGAAIEVLQQRNEGGEDVADLRVRGGGLKGGRRAGRARADHDRRISDPRRGRRLRRGHHPHARSEGASGEGVRPARGHRGHAAAERRRGRDRGRRSDRRTARAVRPAAAWLRPTWITASRCRRW